MQSNWALSVAQLVTAEHWPCFQGQWGMSDISAFAGCVHPLSHAFEHTLDVAGVVPAWPRQVSSLSERTGLFKILAFNN